MGEAGKILEDLGGSDTSRLDTLLNVRMTREMLGQLTEYVARHGITLSEWIRWCVEFHVIGGKEELSMPKPGFASRSRKGLARKGRDWRVSSRDLSVDAFMRDESRGWQTLSDSEQPEQTWR